MPMQPGRHVRECLKLWTIIWCCKYITMAESFQRGCGVEVSLHISARKGENINLYECGMQWFWKTVKKLPEIAEREDDV